MSRDLVNLIVEATGESLFMVSVAASLATLFGLPIGIFLATSRKGELFAAPSVNTVLGVIVNATRSTPFIILVVAIIPFTRLIAGTSIGSGAAIVPLTIAATPFIARLVEAAIREVDGGSDRDRILVRGKSAADRVQGPDPRSAAGARAGADARGREPARLFGDGGCGRRRRARRSRHPLRLSALHAGNDAGGGGGPHRAGADRADCGRLSGAPASIAACGIGERSCRRKSGSTPST